MNRLVIIGNGFDLAHGLKTKYSDFIDDFWKDIIKNYLVFDNKYHFNNDYVEVKIDFHPTNFQLYNDRIKDAIQNVSCYCDIVKLEADNLRSNAYQNKVEIQFKNSFLEIINRKRAEKWVDVESEYYNQLKYIIKLDIKNNEFISDDYYIQKQVKKLNDEFEQIKQLFEKYLKEKVEPDIDKTINDFPEVFIEYKSKKVFNLYLQEFPLSENNELEKFNNSIALFYPHDVYSKIVKGEINYRALFLNFNYTSMLSRYEMFNAPFIKQVQIHGKIDDKNNKINFGFGDEMDDDYKMIENLNENEYLRNFKSFGYSQNSNYKDLLDFIETEKFQVYIMGHSCGISDRTMLNTIFEHNHCRSIKIFYHEWEDENKQKHDNYTELVQNISRHFNKKKLMREKVVNKSLCQSLPQIKNDSQS